MKNYKALRAALATMGTLSQRIDSGIDVCRSPAYHLTVQAWKNACTLNPREKIPAPRLERVLGAAEIRDWLHLEVQRIDALRLKRAIARSVPAVPTLRQRCIARVGRDVRKAYKDCSYRCAESRWAGGHHGLVVLIGAPSADGESTRVWSSNGKWSGNDSEHRISVPLSWIRTVAAQGLAVVDGRLTLAATPVDGRVFAATWVKQSRGVSITTEHGFIFQIDGKWQHAKTLQSAQKQTKTRIAA